MASFWALHAESGGSCIASMGWGVKAMPGYTGGPGRILQMVVSLLFAVRSRHIGRGNCRSAT